MRVGIIVRGSLDIYRVCPDLFRGGGPHRGPVPGGPRPGEERHVLAVIEDESFLNIDGLLGPVRRIVEESLEAGSEKYRAFQLDG